MGRVFQPLLFMFARRTRHELIRPVEFLKAVNEMLRRRVLRRNIWLSSDERRRLLALGEAIGPAVAKIITIVTFSIYSRWRRAIRKHMPTWRRGRPKTSREIQQLVLKIACEMGWASPASWANCGS